MKEFALSGEQLRDLFNALISANRGRQSDSEIQLLEYKPKFIESGLHNVFVRYSLARDSEYITYTLGIGYFNEANNLNPETIELYMIDHRKSSTEGELMVLGRLGYVTDKLREYGIW